MYLTYADSSLQLARVCAIEYEIDLLYSSGNSLKQYVGRRRMAYRSEVTALFHRLDIPGSADGIGVRSI